MRHHSPVPFYGNQVENGFCCCALGREAEVWNESFCEYVALPRSVALVILAGLLVASYVRARALGTSYYRVEWAPSRDPLLPVWLRILYAQTAIAVFELSFYRRRAIQMDALEFCQVSARIAALLRLQQRRNCQWQIRLADPREPTYGERYTLFRGPADRRFSRHEVY